MTPDLARLRERFDAILVDLDGTLLDERSRLTRRAAGAVRRLADAGLLVLLCTGRSEVGAAPVYAELELDTPLVAYNGGWIGRPDGEVWRRVSIPDRLVPDLERAEQDARFSFRHNGGKKYSLRRPHALYERVAAWYTHAVCLDDPQSLPRRSLMRVSCFFDDEEAAGRAWRRVAPSTRDALRRNTYAMALFPEFRDTGLFLSEFEAPSRGKAEVFPFLERERGIERDRVAAVGDHVNDITMLSEAGLAVVMGNAASPVFPYADLVIGRNDEHGFAAWVEAGAPLDVGAQGSDAR